VTSPDFSKSEGPSANVPILPEQIRHYALPVVIHDLVDDALREFADEARQTVLWTAAAGREVSSLDECRCRLFDDSGLGDELERGAVVYAPDVDQQLMSLRRVLKAVDGRRPPEAILRDPGVVRARSLAASILQRLNDLRYEN
jgi:hypothetical protein